MSTPISTIRNLGPAYEEACARAGIHSAEALRTLGADAAYARLLQTGSKPHFIGYYVLVMALQGRPWNDCKGEEKKALRKRFDALKAQNHDKGLGKLETILDQIGVIERRPADPSTHPPKRKTPPQSSETAFLKSLPKSATGD